ncbi:MAG: hypothetical protein M3Z00_13510, partial [Actinomycetota bacterium]|nr:hypothetical protein [Actinomycetota bacterium]
LMPAGRGFQFRHAGSAVLSEARSVAQFRDELQQVDSNTLSWHMHHGDLSRWLAEVVQDRGLATQVGRLERELVQRQEADVVRARERLVDAVEVRYPRDQSDVSVSEWVTEGPAKQGISPIAAPQLSALALTLRKTINEEIPCEPATS